MGCPSLHVHKGHGLVYIWLLNFMQSVFNVYASGLNVTRYKGKVVAEVKRRYVYIG